MKAVRNKIDKFAFKCYLVLISADIANSKQYVLSTQKDALEIPNLNLKKDNIDNIEQHLISYMRDLIFVSDLELIPQIISINNKNVKKNSSEVCVVYGFVVGFTNSINTPKAHWFEFSYEDYTQYSDMIVEVIRKLK